MDSPDIKQSAPPVQRRRTGSPRPAKDASQRILNALDVNVPQQGPPASYTVALGFLVACVVLLPLMYLTLLAFLGWLAVWHVFQAYESLSYGPYIIFHLPMALLGIMLVVFLIKPVFFRKKFETSGVLTLEANDEPLLFAAIEKLCAATGSKMPARIEVDCEANAHARFLRPGDSIKRDGDLVLRIGLPLIAAFSVRQFAGVIGHELGHFNQRRGMTCSYLIRRLTGFFARIVFERDLIDQKLAALRNKRNQWARLLYLVTFALVEPMRGILWLMMLAGELLTCGALRRMEYDADNVEAHLCGFGDFVQTSQSLMMLGIASRQARYDLASSFNQQRLADDLPRLIVLNAQQLAEHHTELMKILECGKTQWFDSHPCHNDRTANAEQLGAKALIDCPDPAVSLFIRFESLCQWATKSMYDGILGETALEGIKLIPTQELADERASYRANTKALGRYLCGHVVAGRPTFPESLDPKSISSADALRKVISARNAMEEQSDVLRATIKQYIESTAILPVATAQLAMCRIFSQNPKSGSVAAKMQKLIRQHGPWRADAIAMLDEFESFGRQRLSCALRLLASSAVAKRMGPELVGGKIAVQQMMSVCSVLEQCLPQVRELSDLVNRLRVFHTAYNPKLPHQPVVTQILATSRAMRKLLANLQSELAATAFPFAHGNEGGITLGDFVVARLPNANDPTDTTLAAASALTRYHDVTFRALSILTLWGEKAEKAANLQPLADLPPDMGDTDTSALSSRRTRKYWLGYGGRAVAGLILVNSLINLSINPPVLPAMPWQSEEDRMYHFQPQAFRVAYQPPISNSEMSQVPVFQSGYRGRVFSMQSGQPQMIVPPSFNMPHPTPMNFIVPPTPMMQMPRFDPPIVQRPFTDLRSLNRPRSFGVPQRAPNFQQPSAPGVPQPFIPGGWSRPGGMPRR